MHVNIKRLLSFLVVLAMVLSMTPVTGIPAIEAKADDTTTESTETTETTVKTSAADDLVFLSDGVTAYCPACKADATWEVYTGQWADTVLNISGTTPRYHYYLTADLEYTTYALQTYENICFHLNGHDVKPAADSTTSARPFSCTQNFDLMGTGTVYGGKVVTANSGTVMAINGGKASGNLEIHSGTLENSEGVTAPLLTIGANGGKINIYGGTVNGDGETIYTYGTNETSTNTNRGYAVVKIDGGTVNGDLNIGYKTTGSTYTAGSSLEFLSGTVNGTVNTLNSSPVTLGGNATATAISVGSGSTLTVKEGWSGSAAVDFADGLTTTNAIAEGDFTGSLVCGGYKLVNKDGALVKGDKVAFDPAAETNYCEACGEYVTWTALNNGENTDGTANHYYVAEDMTAKADRLITGENYKSSGTTYNSVCLHLNGKTLTTGAYKNAAIYGSNGTIINIMGDGTVINGGTGMLFETYTVTVNLYGGTYISNNGKQTMWVAGGNSKIYLYNDAKLEGWVEVNAGKVTLNDSASIEGLTFTDGGSGTVTAAEGWAGFLKNTDGKYLELVDGAWTAVTKTAEWGVFDPKACDGLAYCEACGEEAGAQTWTALSGNNRIGYFGDGNHHHYYLTGDLNMPSTLSQLASVEEGSKLCLNLNGYNITYGGRVYVGANCLLNIFGDGNVTFTGDTTATHATQDYKSAGFHLGATTAVLNLYGGTYSVSGAAKEDGKPTVLTTGKVTLKNATVNGYIAANKGSNIRLEGTAVAEDIRITDTGKVVVAAGWSGTASLTVAESAFENGVLAAANGAAEGEFTGTLTCNGVELSNQNGTLMADITFNPDAETNYCEHCGKYVAWTALHNGERLDTLTVGAAYHVYVAEDMTAASGNFLPDLGAGTFSLCLNLNGKKLTIDRYIYCGRGWTINVMGDGEMISAHTSDPMFYVWTCTVNLYGGTFTTNGTGDVVKMDGASTVVNLYNDVKIEGKVNAAKGKLYLNDSASVTNLAISGTGKTTFKTGWSGSAVVSVEEALVTDNVVSTNSAYVEGDITGTLTTAAGFSIKVENNALVLSNPDKDVFAPWDYNGYAYCPDCGNLVEWTDFNAYVAKNGFHDENNTLTDTSGVITLHFYLSADLEYTTNVMNTYENVIFNLNGYNITPVAAEGAEEITAGYAFSSTQGLVLLNTADTMSTVTGWQTKAGQATVLHLGGGGSSSWARLYDNVTLTTHEDCTTDAPVVHVGSNGGKLYMKGGVIDASKKTNNLYPTAVYVQGRTTLYNNNLSTGYFYLSGGEIKGGTSVTGAGAVQIGSRVTTNAEYVDGAYFYMTAGTISGGNANYGGNILINKNAAEVKITGGTITGGTAKHGGNIYCHDCDLTIGGTAVISDGTVDAGAGFGGGGNIHFGQGTLTVEGGTISGGKVNTTNGSGGNIYLDKQSPDNAAAGSEVSPTHFIMTDGAITGGYVQDSQDDQNFGGNIRAYNVSTFSVTGGSITGGTGCSEQRANSANLYISYSDAHVNNGWPANVTFGGTANIDGNVCIKGKANLVLTGAPVIASGTYGLTYDNEKTLADISGLTEGAQIELSEMVHNVPMTKEDTQAPGLVEYITVIDSKATLTVEEGQLILIGVAIVDGETVTWYADNAAAVAAYTYADGKYIQLGVDTALELLGGEYLIDLAGNVAGEVAITGTGTVHLFDSANADYDGYRTVTVADTVTLAERDHTVIVDEEAVRFIIVTDAEGKTSAHALDMAVTGVNLRTDAAGLYYSANYKCDDVLAGLVSAYGVILSLKDMPGAVKTSDDQRTELTDFAPGTYATSSSVSGIFKDTRDAAKNAAYGKMKIYANAYIQLDLDADGVADVLVADTENAGKTAGNAWSLYDVMLTIDQNWADYADDQEAVKAFYDNWFDLGMSEYADDFENIDVKIDVEGGEGDGVTPEDTDVDVEV